MANSVIADIESKQGVAEAKPVRADPWRTMTPEEADTYMREIAARPVAPLSAAALERRT